MKRGGEISMFCVCAILAGRYAPKLVNQGFFFANYRGAEMGGSGGISLSCVCASEQFLIIIFSFWIFKSRFGGGISVANNYFLKSVGTDFGIEIRSIFLLLRFFRSCFCFFCSFPLRRNGRLWGIALFGVCAILTGRYAPKLVNQGFFFANCRGAEMGGCGMLRCFASAPWNIRLRL